MAGIGPARLGNGKTLMLLHPERFFSRGAPSNAMNRIRDFLRSGFARPDEWHGSNYHGSNYVVVRHSPDWLSFDPEASRAYCLSNRMPETLIVDFMAIWDA